MTNVRDDVPLPQVAEQELQVPHEPTQLTGQLAVLQFCVCCAPLTVLHGNPPFAAAVLIEKLRICVPPPQVAEHDPQLPQAPTQLVATAQAFGLHACDSVAPAVVRHAVPPCAALIEILYVRTWVPPPHVAEHTP
jgi:hypothetical protein